MEAEPPEKSVSNAQKGKPFRSSWQQAAKPDKNTITFIPSAINLTNCRFDSQGYCLMFDLNERPARAFARRSDDVFFEIKYQWLKRPAVDRSNTAEAVRKKVFSKTGRFE